MKLITINIERDKHLSRVLPFITKEQPDVICVQEMFEPHLTLFEAEGYTCSFLPVTMHPLDGISTVEGIAICSKTTTAQFKSFLYHPASETLQTFDVRRISETNRRGVVLASIVNDDNEYIIGNTHFTWTPQGETPNEAQQEHLPKLLDVLSTEEAHILCGDFNIPRNQSPLYDTLIKTYTDNIPLKYTSSLDRNLHRLGNVPELNKLFESFMVDYVFSKPPYVVTDVRLEFGISDHAAVVATVTK